MKVEDPSKLLEGTKSLRDHLGKILPLLGRRDTMILVLSLLLAFVIWLFQSLGQNYTEVVRVPLKVECRLEGHAPLSSNTAVLQARCTASGYQVFRIRRARTRRPLRLSVGEADMHQGRGDFFYMTSNDINRYAQDIFGNDSHVEAILSDTLRFIFPEVYSRKVPVRPISSVTYSSQYMSRDGLRIVPDSVTIQGEPYLIDPIEDVYTEAVFLENLVSSVSGDVKLRKIRGVDMSVDKVEYSVDVQRYVELTEDLTVFTTSVPHNRILFVYPSTAKISLRCAFPVTVDPKQDIHLSINYQDFQGSLQGKCLPRVTGLSDAVLSYEVDPPVFDCVESYN